MNAHDILSRIPKGDSFQIGEDTIWYEIKDSETDLCSLRINGGDWEPVPFDDIREDIKAKLEEIAVERSTPTIADKVREWWSTHPKRNHENVADLFISLHNERVCYSYELGLWMLYNGKYWETDDAGEIENILISFNKSIIDVVEEMCPARLATETYEQYEKKKKPWERALTWSVGLNNRGALDNVLSIASKKCAKSLNDFDTNDWLFNVNNGTIDLRTGHKHDHDAADMITLLCDVDYYPDAEFKKWDDTLLESCGGRLLYVRWLQKLFGYCLTGVTDEELLIMLLGRELTGKSTLYEPVLDVFGDYGHYMSFNTLQRSDKDGGGAREDLLRLRTCRLVMCSEINEKTVFDTALVKKIASGENLSARAVYGRHTVEFPPKFKICIGTNYPPIIPYDDGGSYRRIKVNPFLNQVENVDKTLKRVLRTNKAARERTLAWLVDGCLAWQREGLNDVPREVERGNAAYRRSQNPISDFIEDYCILDRDAGTTVKKLVDTFNYSRDEYGAPELSSKSFGRYMKALGYETYHTTTERGYVGIRLKTPKEDDLDFYDIEDAWHRSMTYDVYPGSFLLSNFYDFKNVKSRLVQTSDLNVIRHNNNQELAAHLKTILEDVAKAATKAPIAEGYTRDMLIKFAADRLKAAFPDSDAYRFVERMATEDKDIEALIADIMRGRE